jgi:hypothetical protein
VLGHTLGFAAMTMPASVYVGLCGSTTPPTAAFGGTEVAGGGYTRMAATFAISTSTNVAANTATVEFPAATTPWGTLGYFEIWDAATAGRRLYWGPLVDPADGVTPVSRSVLTGDIMRFTAGIIQVRAV